MNKIIICVAVYDTVDNKRTIYTKKTFESLKATINTETTKVIFIDNASCEETKIFLAKVVKNNPKNFSLITNKENKGTAEAINLGWKEYIDKGYYLVKLDNDVTFGRKNWADEMVECFEMDSKLGILGLKRKDLPNQPESKEYPTQLKYLKHDIGDKWKVIEVCGDIIGTCLMFSPKLLDKIGFLYQPSIYGFDDVLACTRSMICDFYNAFYPCVDIEHLDDGKNPFSDWKRKHAGIYLPKIKSIEESYWKNPETIYYNPFKG